MPGDAAETSDGLSLQTCLAALAEAARLPEDHPDRVRLYRLLRELRCAQRRQRRAQRRSTQRAEHAAAIARTATGSSSRPADRPLTETVSDAGVVPRWPGVGERCHICRVRYTEVDAFYHRLCPPCARENRRRRTARCDLTGRLALVTGGRVKIGHELALKLLRDGARVIVISRFPHDTRQRFAAAADHAQWWDRLRVAALDLRDVPRLVAWCDALAASGESLDILVNNAAQTIRRSPQAYAPLLAAERAALGSDAFAPPSALGPGGAPVRLPDACHGVPSTGRRSTLPAEVVDAAGLVADDAPANSWSRLVDEVDPAELVEVQLVNATAPFVLLSRLLPMLDRSPHPRRYVVNVSAVEGQFVRPHKSPRHPHTNMAKAALNMLTRTSASELAARRIYLTSVDTGWITDERPLPSRLRAEAGGFRPPLDVVDGAARVYDPIVRGERDGDPPHGCFLKDYRVTDW